MSNFVGEWKTVQDSNGFETVGEVSNFEHIFNKTVLNVNITIVYW